MPMPAVICEPQAKPVAGLAALPESWIPMGVHLCYVHGPWGGSAARLSRTPDSFEIRFEKLEGPSVVCTDLKDGSVRVEIEGPSRPFCTTGPFHWWADRARFEDRVLGRNVDLYRSLDGKLVLEIHNGHQRLGIYHLLF